MRNVRVFEADLASVTAGVFRRARLTTRAEGRAARRMREALRGILTQIVRDAYRDGSAPYRTGRSQKALLKGARAFGQTFNGLRGHIIGPEYIAAHETGATIRPKAAKALAIPLPAALRPDGTPKLPGPNSWRNVGTFIYVSQNTGRAYIAYKAATGQLTLLYSLVQEVEIKKKAFLTEAWNNRKDDLMQEFGQIMMFELSQIDLLALARIKPGGRSRR